MAITSNAFRTVLIVVIAAVVGSSAGCGGDTTSGRPLDGSRADTGSTADDSATPTAGPSVSSAPSNTAPLRVTGMRTTLTLDASFVSALTTLKITPGLSGSAKLSGSDVLLPISGGSLTVPASGANAENVRGTIEHAGSGISLTAGTVKLTLADLSITFRGSSPTVEADVIVNGKTVAARLRAFDLDLSRLVVSHVSNGTITLGGIGVLVSTGFAAVLKASFRTTAIRAKLRVADLRADVSGS